MPDSVPFETLLHYLQEHGWELKKVWKPYRVFEKRGGSLPLLILVRDKMVDKEYVERAKKAVEAQYEQDES